MSKLGELDFLLSQFQELKYSGRVPNNESQRDDLVKDFAKKNQERMCNSGFPRELNIWGTDGK